MVGKLWNHTGGELVYPAISPDQRISACSVISSSSHEPGAGNLGSELPSHQVWEPQTRTPTIGLTARLLGSEVASILAQLPNATGMPVSQLVNRIKGVDFLCRLPGFDTVSLSCTLLLGHKTGWFTLSSLKRLWLHILFSLAYSFRVTYPHFPGNLSAQSPAQLDQKNI